MTPRLERLSIPGQAGALEAIAEDPGVAAPSFGIPGAGHFFHGRLHELRDAVIDAIRSG
jgi:hypothetical protein